MSIWNTSSLVSRIFSRAGMSLDYVLFKMWDEVGDTRTMPYAIRPWPLVVILAVYLSFVLYFGPRHMNSRPAYDLRWLMLRYNLVNVYINAFLFLAGLYLTNLTADCWGCRDDRHIKVRVRVIACYSYLVLKVFDLLDTVFFVLRKKNNQITPLHLIHHSIMPLTAYIALKFVPNTTACLTLICNTLVHTVMYLYYYMAALGPEIQPQLWWKRYITVVQLAQFVVLGSQAASMLFIANCTYPPAIIYLQLAESGYFLVTFAKFYKKTYIDVNKDKNKNMDPIEGHIPNGKVANRKQKKSKAN